MARTQRTFDFMDEDIGNNGEGKENSPPLFMDSYARTTSPPKEVDNSPRLTCLKNSIEKLIILHKENDNLSTHTLRTLLMPILKELEALKIIGNLHNAVRTSDEWHELGERVEISEGEFLLRHLAQLRTYQEMIDSTLEESQDLRKKKRVSEKGYLKLFQI